jgi:hypothetical protein
VATAHTPQGSGRAVPGDTRTDTRQGTPTRDGRRDSRHSAGGVRRGAPARAHSLTRPRPPRRHTATQLVLIRHCTPVAGPPRARRLPACRDHRADRAPRGKYQVHGDTTKSKTIKTCVSLPTPAHTATHAAAALRRRCRTSGRPLRSTRLSSLVRSTSSLDASAQVVVPH